MSESPEDRPRERRRTGPLGNEEETRREPRGEKQTQQIRTRQRGNDRTVANEAGSARKEGGSEGTGTRVLGASDTRSGRDAAPSRGYFEAMEEREERLREIYGGADWLASFLGFVFALVAGAVLSLVAGLALVMMGFSIDFSGALGSAAITGLAIIGLALFLTYFFGGYVAGRLARFDGGLNGILVFLWTIVVAVLVAVAGGFLGGLLPEGTSERVRGFIQDSVLATVGDLTAAGAVGIGVLVAAVLLALLGGFVGGRVGGRYHTDIDYTL